MCIHFTYFFDFILFLCCVLFGVSESLDLKITKYALLH